MKRAFVALIILGCLSMAGCTLSAGDWFVNLRPSFEGRYASLTDRDLGDSWQKLNTDYQARMTRALVTVDDIQLQDLSGGGRGAAFDPANPPSGYSLCHNEHCHRDDGALVPYAEIAAETAGGGNVGVEAVVSLPVGQADLLLPARRPLTCQPGCGLPEAQIERARARLTQLTFEGLVRDGRSPARLAGEVPWRWETTMAADAGGGDAPITLDCPADLPADSAHSPNVTLELTLELTGRLLDDIDWAAVVPKAGVIDLSATPNLAARNLLRENLAEGELTAAIHRTD
jgi:hypothetical protein